MNEIEAKLKIIFAEDLNLAAPDAETDILATGMLDSMSLVELLIRLETVFGLTIPISDLEIDSFRTISGIAALVAKQSAPKPLPAKA